MFDVLLTQTKVSKYNMAWKEERGRQEGMEERGRVEGMEERWREGGVMEGGRRKYRVQLVTVLLALYTSTSILSNMELCLQVYSILTHVYRIAGNVYRTTQRQHTFERSGCD